MAQNLPALMPAVGSSHMPQPSAGGWASSTTTFAPAPAPTMAPAPGPVMEHTTEDARNAQKPMAAVASVSGKDESDGKPKLTHTPSGNRTRSSAFAPPAPHEDFAEDEQLDREKLRLLHAIAQFTEDDEEKGRKDRWIRSLPLLVMVYEGIITEVFDYDYAPQAERVGGKRIYLNISQEGRDDIDDLRDRGFILALKLTSENYQSSLALRVSPKGSEYLNRFLDEESREEVNKLIHSEDGSELTRVVWDPEADENGGFKIVSEEAGTHKVSTITDIEAVSYVSSPYVPNCLRTFGQATSNNADRVDELKQCVSDLKDELTENLTLDDVVLLVCEWVPMGGNQIVALNDKLGSSERVQGGFFTATLDDSPDSTQFRGESEGLTAVNLLDYDETMYVNFEAEVFYPSEPGILQIENFGVHFGESGLIAYGLVLDAIQDRVKTRLSLDLMSRLLVDVHQDTSKVVANLLAPQQKLMLDLTFLNDAENRDKFNVIIGEFITPKMMAEKYMDKEDNENELKQVVGDTYSGHDLDSESILVLGKMGLLVAGQGCRRHEPFLMLYASLQACNIFMKSVFNRCFILADYLKNTRDIIETYEDNPNNVNIIRERLSIATEQCIMLSEIQVFLLESCGALEYPTVIKDDPGSKTLAGILKLEIEGDRLRRRAVDIEKTIEGCRNELEALREMANVIAESESLRTQESLQQNTKNLEDCFRAGARQGTSLEIMNVVFAGSLAFDMVDRFTGQYMSIADQIGWMRNASVLPKPLQFYLTEVPMVWFILNMSVWGLLGGGLIWFMRYVSYMSMAIETKKAKINQMVNGDALNDWLATKPITSQDVEEDARTSLRKYAWDETDKVRWEGLPPRIELLTDQRYSYILQIFIMLNKRRCKVDGDRAFEMLLQELEDFGVINNDQLKDNIWQIAAAYSRKPLTEEIKDGILDEEEGEEGSEAASEIASEASESR